MKNIVKDKKLHVRYRPTCIRDVYGNNNVKEFLSNSDEVASNDLICLVGAIGNGKTVIANILHNMIEDSVVLDDFQFVSGQAQSLLVTKQTERVKIITVNHLRQLAGNVIPDVVLELNKPCNECLVSLLANICMSEDITFKVSELEQIAECSGSVRDAIISLETKYKGVV